MGLASDLIQRVKLGVSQLKPAVKGTTEEVSEYVRKHPVTSGVTVGGGILAGTTIVQVMKRRKKAKKTTAKKKAKKRKSKTTTRGRDRLFKSKQKHEQRYKRKKPYKVYGRKGYINPKSKSRKRVGKIYYTKKGQPYKIMASGKARFIKKTKRGKR